MQTHKPKHISHHIEERNNNNKKEVIELSRPLLPPLQAFHPTQTVEEAIDFYAQLRLGHSATQSEKRHVVDFLLADVGLAGKEKQYVGGILPGGLSVTGLSGGERRRLALCCGAVTNPDLMFLDEVLFFGGEESA